MSSSAGFGNYMLKGIEEIAPLSAVPWDFNAPGWPYLFTFLIVCFALSIFNLWRKWQANAYRRTALAALRNVPRDEALRILPALLKSTAIATFGREPVASLYGENWLSFLDESLPQLKPVPHSESAPAQGFTGTIGRLFIALSYQNFHSLDVSEVDAEKLLCLARHWISAHRRPAHD